VLALTPKRIGAGQSVMVSIDQRRTLEPSPKETQVIIEQDNARYIATIEKRLTRRSDSSRELHGSSPAVFKFAC
jgi:hypothetical protein